MRTVLATICAALIVILAAGAALYFLAGDLFGAGLFLILTIADVIVLWFALDYNRRYNP